MTVAPPPALPTHLVLQLQRLCRHVAASQRHAEQHVALHLGTALQLAGKQELMAQLQYVLTLSNLYGQE